MTSANKRKWKVRSLCMGAAIVFWFLNALNKVYTTEINYPVSFIADSPRVVFDKPLPSTLRIEVVSSGWILLKYWVRLGGHPVEIPITKVLKKGHIRADRLSFFCASRLKDLKVNRVILDEVPSVRTVSFTPSVN